MTLEASAISATTPLARSGRVLLGTYAVTVFLGAALLFFVQPMVSKMLLPHLGGSPSVWNTCMVLLPGDAAAWLSLRALAGAAVRRRARRRRSTAPCSAPPRCSAARPDVAGAAGRRQPGAVAARHARRHGRPAVLRDLGDGAAAAALVLPDQPPGRAPTLISSTPPAMPAASWRCSPIRCAVEPHLRLFDQSRWWALGLVALAAGIALCWYGYARNRNGAQRRPPPKRPAPRRPSGSAPAGSGIRSCRRRCCWRSPPTSRSTSPRPRCSGSSRWRCTC